MSSIDTDALVDSGANISVFREEIAECLEIVIEDGEEILLQGLGGRIVGYIQELKGVYNKFFLSYNGCKMSAYMEGA